MPPPDVPSPTPSNMPPPPTKRPRQTAAAASTAGAGGGGASTPGGASASGGGAPRAKRRKPEGSVGPDSTDGRDARKQTFGVGMAKGKEDDFAEDKDIQTRIDFNTLPLETLYRYLEMHDLLPRWDVSPWSEEPCIPPNALFANPPPVPAVPVPSSPQLPNLPNPLIPSSPGASIVVPVASEASLVQSAPVPAPGAPASESQNPATATEDVPSAPMDADGAAPLETAADDAATKQEPLSLEDEEAPAPPTTRSKTLPYRKPPTPTPEPTPAPEINRGVVTLSDVHAAREVLAEKANAHWVKGLGGGQNKEGETIVNFLYKMKAGPGRLLKLYVPTAASSPS